MITVRCGYEGCNWSSKYSDVVVSTDYTGHIATYDGSQMTKYILHIDLLKHLEAKHGIPSAIWER